MRARRLLRAMTTHTILGQPRAFSSSCSCRNSEESSSSQDSSSKGSPWGDNDIKRSPYDDLFSGPDPFPRTSISRPRWLTPERREKLSNTKVPRSVLFASEDREARSESRPRRKLDRTPLTPSEANAFFSLLNETIEKTPPTNQPEAKPFGAFTDMISHPSPRDRNAQLLQAYANRNRVAPRIKSRKVFMEGLAASISPAQLESGIDEAREELTMCENEHEVWNWAGKMVWSKDGKFGTKTPFYAPVLHLLLLTLRDRYKRPHSALAVHSITRNLGIESYVLGCTAPLYVELLKTRWDWLADLRGCRDAVKQARESGVLANPIYRRREVRHTKLAPPVEDEGIREVVDRIKSEARKMVLQAVATRSKESQDQYLYGDEESRLLEPHFAQKQMLDIADELGRLAGPPTRLLLDDLDRDNARRKALM